ncbi:MAG: glutamate racemase [Verrucomicrobiae bacterium]|nr:glutamate racemase [Verrucomicrobiae bacterium]
MSPSPTPVRIGLLDSGVGGLTVLREIHRLIPGADLHYVGDSAWCPYGNKSPEVIQQRVFEISDHLLAHGAEILVIACNSATIQAVGALRAAYPLPVVGMEPGVKPAAERSRSGVIGVLATEASLAGEKFHQLVSTHARGVRVITRPCPRFVELVESGVLDGPDAEAAVDEALSPLLEAGSDVLVLGCTHYPFLRPVIERRVPAGTEVIDTGPAVARRVASQLPGTPPPGGGTIQIETTGSLASLERLLPILMAGITASASECRIGQGNR